MAIDPYTERLRRAAIACLSTSLRHGTPQMLDALCDLERAVYTAAPVAPPSALRERVIAELNDGVMYGVCNECDQPCGCEHFGDAKEITELVLAVIASPVDVLMAMVEEYGQYRADQVAAWEVGTSAQADHKGFMARQNLAAIRARLEGREG